jgi:hypothetical protein
MADNLDLNRFNNYSDDELMECAQFYRRILDDMINRGLTPTEPGNHEGSVNSLLFNKYAQKSCYVEILLRQRTNSEHDEVEVEAEVDDEDEDNDEVDMLPDVTLPSLPILDPLPSPPVTITITLDNPSQDATKSPDIFPPPPLSQLPPLPSCSPITIITTSPPDTLAPPPFPPSPNILTQPHLHKPHLPPNQNSPDIPAPIPLPLKPNIPVYRLSQHIHFKCSRTNIIKRGPDVSCVI